MRKTKVALTALLATAAVVSCAAASQAGASAATARTGTAHIVVWSVNSDGPRFQAILTGAIGDYGPAVTVTPDGAVDPDHTSELELNLSHGSFRLSIAKLAAEFARSAPHWPYDRATCSVHAAVTGPAPIVAGTPAGVGYLLKDRVADVSDFIAAVSRVAAGGTVLDPEVVARLLNAGRHRDALGRREARSQHL
jgi:DNA-binding NarL/FixJ family response regulator